MPIEGSDEDRDRGGREAHDERHPGAVDQRGEDVLAGVIGPEQVRGRWGLEDVVDRDLDRGVGVVRRNERGEDRHDDRREQHHEADDARIDDA